jgi:hypothetical protein
MYGCHTRHEKEKRPEQTQNAQSPVKPATEPKPLVGQNWQKYGRDQAKEQIYNKTHMRPLSEELGSLIRLLDVYLTTACRNLVMSVPDEDVRSITAQCVR